MKISLLALACVTSINIHSEDTLKEFIDLKVRTDAKKLYDEYMAEIIKEDELEQRIIESIDSTGSEDVQSIKSSLEFKARRIPRSLLLHEKLGYCADANGNISRITGYKYEEAEVIWQENSAQRELPKLKERNALLEQVVHVSQVQYPTREGEEKLTSETSHKEFFEFKKTHPVIWKTWENKNPTLEQFTKVSHDPYTRKRAAYSAYEIVPIKSESSDVVTAALRIVNVSVLILQ